MCEPRIFSPPLALDPSARVADPYSLRSAAGRAQGIAVNFGKAENKDGTKDSGAIPARTHMKNGRINISRIINARTDGAAQPVGRLGALSTPWQCGQVIDCPR
jgi:hypothetical protein